MICTFCDGKGWPKAAKHPCEECGGTGFLHCCEGLIETPEGACNGGGEEG